MSGRAYAQQPDPEGIDRAELEGTIARARVAALAVAVSTVAGVAPISTRSAAFLAAYFGWSVVLLIRSRPETRRTTSRRTVAHVTDLLGPLAVAALVPGSAGAVAGLAVLPVLAAALRWGSVSAATSSVSLGLVLRVAPVPVAASHALAVALAAIVFTASVGSRRRRHAAILRGIRTRCEDAAGFGPALVAALDAIADTFECTGARVLLTERRSGRTFVWVLRRDEAGAAGATCTELVDRHQREAADQPRGTRLSLGVANWSGELELFQPSWRLRLTDNRYLVQRIVADLIPVLHPAYRAAHAEARSASRERAKLARELHDGLVQSLIGADMHIERLRRQAYTEGVHAPIGSELQHVQRILRQETLSVRELMARLKPLEVTCEELPRFVQQIVDRFCYDSGIRAELSTDGPPAVRSRRDCIDVARILQEALSNVRKHSGATRVRIDLRWASPDLALMIDDNGCGFPFEGTARYSAGRLDLSDCQHADEPQLRPLVPSAIVECVRSLAGELRVVSLPGRGARLEVAVPARSAFGRAASRDRIAS